MRTGRPAKRSRKILRVLAREQRRRRDDRGLLAVDRRGEGGAQRHLGLAEADVAADQPVHRPAGGEVVERRFDRALLVRRLVVGKAGAEFVVEALRHGEARRGVRHALGGDANELARHLAHALLQPRLARLPARAAEPVELARLRAVARQELEVFDRQEQPVARRHSGSRGSRAARPQPRSSSRPTKRPTPWSIWTTRSPAVSALASASTSCARRLRFDWRTSRSPRMSCSPMMAKSGASNPCSSAITASGSAPARAVFA